MTDLIHRVALIDGAGALVRGPVPVDDTWPSPRELRAAVGAPTAVEVVPAWRADDGVIVHVLQDAGAPAPAHADPVWPPAAPALAERASGGGEGWPGWYLRGWGDEVAAWVGAALSARGLHRVGDPEVVTWWGLSAVLRIPVAGADADGACDVWFKATCDGFHDEPAITAALARRPGAPVPDVLAVDTARAWMLLGDVPGAGEEPDLATVRAAATAMARLQLASLDHSEDAVLPVRDADATIRDLAAVVHDSVEAHLLPDDLRAAARAAEPKLARAVQALHEAGLPLTLVHGDLHTQNLAGTPERPVIFDWTDACWAHPYLDGRLLAASAVRRRAEDADGAAVEAAVRDAFTAPWREAFPHLDHDDAWARAADALEVFQMVSYEHIQRAQPAASRWALAGVIGATLRRLTVGGGA